MSKHSRSSVVLALLVTGSVLSTGIVGAALADRPSTADAQSVRESSTAPDDDAIVENFTERIETLETVEFTRTMEAGSNGDTSSTTVRVVADLESNQKRIETVESSYGSNATTVVNETHSRTYDADDNTVTTAEIGANARGYSMLPQLTRLANESAIEYEVTGTGTVAGDEVYRLNATPTETVNEQNVSITIAVDTETYFPVQVNSEVRSDRYNVSITRTYSNVSINEDVPESAFELDVPADATDQSNTGPEITSYDGYSNLQSAAELTLPDAELPGGYEFDSAEIVDGDGYYLVSVTYADGKDHIQVSVRQESSVSWSERDGIEKVSLGDETGYYNEYGEYGFLHVDSGEQHYHVYGALEEDQLVDIGTAVVDS